VSVKYIDYLTYGVKQIPRLLALLYNRDRHIFHEQNVSHLVCLQDKLINKIGKNFNTSFVIPQYKKNAINEK